MGHYGHIYEPRMSYIFVKALKTLDIEIKSRYHEI